MRSTLKFCAIALVAILASCATTSGDAAAPVNVNCPLAGEPIVADASATFEDTTVGFCCKNCLGKFEVMDDAEKREVVTKAMTN